MNSGVGSIGSPIPKSISSMPARARRRLRLVEPDERIRLQRLEHRVHSVAPKRLKRVVRPRRARDLDALVLRVRVARRARAEVHGVEPLRRELGDRRPRLLRLEREAAGLAQRLHERRPGGDARGRRVAEQLQLAAAVHELAEARLGLRRRAVGRVAEVERRRRASRGSRSSRSRPRSRVTLSTSRKTSPSISTSCGSRRASGASASTARMIALSPSHGRAECALSPWKTSSRVQVAEAARLDRVVGRLEHDDELGVEPVPLEEAGQRALARGQLLAPEEEVAERRARRARARSSPRARPSCRVAPRPTTQPSSIRPGQVVLRGHGVVVPREHDLRRDRTERCRRRTPARRASARGRAR